MQLLYVWRTKQTIETCMAVMWYYLRRRLCRVWLSSTTFFFCLCYRLKSISQLIRNYKTAAKRIIILNKFCSVIAVIWYSLLRIICHLLFSTWELNPIYFSNLFSILCRMMKCVSQQSAPRSVDHTPRTMFFKSLWVATGIL